MKLTEFIEGGQPGWTELDELSSRARRRGESLGGEGIRRLTDLYRAASADLAVARRLFPRDPVVADLETRVLRARGILFDRSGRREGLVSFFGATYWRLIAERSRPMLLAAAMLSVPALFGAVWATADPSRVIGILPPEFLWVTEAQTTDQGYGTAGLIGFSTFVMQNNIRVTLLAFALGITWGLMSGYVIAQNGLILGAIAGLAIGAGNHELFLAAVAAHGVLEMSCIVIGGGTGFALARSILRPGTRTRRESLADEARSAALVAIGTVPWLVVAGLIEGFVSRTGTTWVPAVIIGVVIGGGFWWLVWFLGVRPFRGAL
ncbi:MAG: stage II sporulation protein M [Acidimicrobiia bacterium]|nr:stage II sporulation protein M [Acidimicrobiia bacterium]MDH4308724.1 stage II sporulation protein M [Acidimicrobiia bacterium]MDH5292470.1 stage II sporulation protein M [Acidimicrobiia bacterium]